MFGIEATSAYILMVGLAALLVAVIVWQRQRSGKTIVVWLASSVVGILLGMAGTLGVARLAGYEFTLVPPQGEGGAEASRGGMQGGEGGGMRGFGGPRGPSAKRDLTTTVRKLDWLTGDIAVRLTDDQAASLVKILAAIETPETMTDEDAQARLQEVLSLLTDDQKARLDAIGLPRTAFGGRGEGTDRGGGQGGGESIPDANPFKQDANAEALLHLRERLAQGKQGRGALPTPQSPIPSP